MVLRIVVDILSDFCCNVYGLHMKNSILYKKRVTVLIV